MHITEIQIANLFHSFQEGSKLCESFMQIDYEHVTKDEWLALRKSQNKQLSQCYAKNEELMKTVWEPIIQFPEQLSDSLCDCLCNWLEDMYEKNYDDPYTLYQLASILVKHYETREKEELDRLIFSLKACAYGATEMSRTEDHERGRESVELFERILNYRYRLHEMKKDSSRAAVFIAYANLLRVEGALENMPIRKVYDLWKEYLEYRSQPYSHQYDETISRIPELCDFLERDFQCYVASDYYKSMMCKDGTLSKEFDQNLFVELASLSGEYLSHMIKESGGLKRDWFYYYYNYEELLALEGKQTWREAFCHMRDYTREHREEMEHFEEMQDPVAAISNPCSRLIEALYYSDLSMKEKSDYALYYSEMFIRLAKRINVSKYTYSINRELTDFCFNHPLLACIQSDEKKERLFYELLLARHPATYMHSAMVQRIALMTLDVVIEQHPEYLIGLMKTKNVQQVREHGEEIRRFVAHAAIFHDVGKNRIIDIVVTEHRKINEEEVRAIRRHPMLGAEFLSVDPAFYAYRDIALGHHKYYNGKEGYPENFDNLRSEAKPLIDLITICDCVDAATDYISRNFHAPKTLKQVMAELKKEAGTRYHPGYVELMEQDKELFDRMEYLVSHERESIYYEIFRQCLSLDLPLPENLDEGELGFRVDGWRPSE